MFLGKNDDGSYFAWKEKKGKLVKQNLELGEYNSENMEYQILKGLTTDDYIAFPSDELFEGQSVTHSEDAIGNIGDLDQDIDMDNFDGNIDFDNVDGDGDVDFDNVDGDGNVDLDNVDEDGDIDSDNNDDEPDTPEEDAE